MNQFFLYIESFTQNAYSGDPEKPVQPDQIDHEKNLHVYLTGNIAKDRSVALRAGRRTILVTAAKASGRRKSEIAAQKYKASLPHYSLSGGADYLLYAADDAQDPWALASHEIRTL